MPHPNQNAWNNLEKYSRSLTRTYQNVYVCTGHFSYPGKARAGGLGTAVPPRQPNQAPPGSVSTLLGPHSSGSWESLPIPYLELPILLYRDFGGTHISACVYQALNLPLVLYVLSCHIHLTHVLLQIATLARFSPSSPLLGIPS